MSEHRPRPRLDRIDRQILAQLQANGRISNQELAERVALSPAPCLRRVRRLEQAGVIRGYAAVLDRSLVGMSLLAYVNVKLEKRGGAQRGRTPDQLFDDAVRLWPEVVACHAMTGDLDYLIRVQARDLDHFSNFMMERLLKHPGVLDVRSSFSLKTIKDSTAIELDELEP